MKFEDTQLLDHPTVRKAYAVMRGFFSNGDDFAREAVKGGELITKYAANPDPDAVAAAVLQGGMIIPYRPESFTKTVSPGAAALLKAFNKLRITRPVFASEGERQFMLALNVGALKDLREKIIAGDFFKYKEIKKMIDNNARTLEAAADGMADQQLADIARQQLDATRTSLDDLCHVTKEKMKFENSGLPDHPTVKKAYAMIRASETKNDILFTNRTELGASTAKILYETGASTDPDVLGAAILNQHTLIKGRINTKKMIDEDWQRLKDEGLAELRQMFSARLVEIYLDTSPFGLSYNEQQKRPVTEERKLISAAMYVHLLETEQERFAAQKKLNDADFKSYTGPRILERIEYYADIVRKQAQNMPHPALTIRMEKAILAATKLMNTPANVAIRKPGSPSLDGGW